MQRLLLKRTLREWKKNRLRYAALLLLVALAMFLVVGVVNAAWSTICTVREKGEENHLEDGSFTLARPLEEEEREALEEGGVELEAVFSLDFGLEDGSVLRVMENRQNIDQVELSEGKGPASDEEIMLERIYGQVHSLGMGDSVTLADRSFTVSGLGTSPDYELCLKDFSDMAADGSAFGTAFVTAEAYRFLAASGQARQAQEDTYAFRLTGREDAKGLKEKLEAALPGQVLRFVEAEDNPRIGAAADDVSINIRAGLAAGALVLVLLAFVISVFQVHTIDQESPVIGALYSLGVRRGDLLLHYTLLPVLLCLAGGALGTALGYSPMALSFLGGETSGYFSIPVIEVQWEPLLLLYGIALPPAAAFLVNLLVIRKRLGQSALSLLRGMEEGKKAGYSGHLSAGSFVRTFQLRRLLREKRSCLAVLAGMFLSLLVLDLGLNCYVMCRNIRRHSEEDTKFAYMYQLKERPDSVPEGAYPAYVETFSKESLGYELEVSVIGLAPDNPFFPEIQSGQENEISVSASVAEKYGLEEGDSLTLTGKSDEKEYTFAVVQVLPYSVGLSCFMEMDSLRQLFDREKGFYNVLYADHALSLEPGQIYSVTTGDDVVRTGDIFIENMSSMITVMTVTAALMFLIVLYQMMKVMVDRAGFGLSLMRLLGYRDRELRRLYLDGSFLLTALGAAALIPLAKQVMDLLYPSLVANVACGLDLAWPWQLYGGVYAGILLCCRLIQALLSRRIRKVTPREVLKRRE